MFISHVFSDRHSDLLRELNAIRRLHVDHEINHETTLVYLQQQILDMSKTMDNNLALFMAQVIGLRIKLERLDEEAEVCKR
jgi:hypothetical protein